MILLTVGTQLPFDRLVSVIDDNAHYFKEEVVAQIGDSDYQAKNIQTSQFMSPDEMENLLDQATLVISHAGMGTIINCVNLGIPIIVMPRLSKFKEHRNDHQVDTVEAFGNVEGVYVIYDERDLIELIKQRHSLAPPSGFDSDEKAMMKSFLESKINRVFADS